MDDESPYRASQVVLTPPSDSGAAEAPRSITRPITHLWILLCVQTAFAVVWGLIQIFNAPSMALWIGATYGTTAVINAALAYGVYKRVLWVAIVVASINVISLCFELVSLARGDVSIFGIGLVVAVTFFAVRGAMAVRAYRRFLRDARVREAGAGSGHDASFGGNPQV